MVPDDLAARLALVSLGYGAFQWTHLGLKWPHPKSDTSDGGLKWPHLGAARSWQPGAHSRVAWAWRTVRAGATCPLPGARGSTLGIWAMGSG